jgi:hypothetical protein
MQLLPFYDDFNLDYYYDDNEHEHIGNDHNYDDFVPGL